MHFMQTGFSWNSWHNSESILPYKKRMTWNGTETQGFQDNGSKTCNF